jgi:tetratricopeptide (TPR) repeat protein/transcription elongation GreA/GreB family factor
MARPSKARGEKAPNPKPKPLQKKVASPISTGGRGGAFEQRVQAVRLLAMCLGIPCAGLREGFVIVGLLFQGRGFDHNTDDLVVHATSLSTGQKATIRMQMKRSLKATANDVFTEAVGLAWLDFSKPTFQRGLDDNLIVYHVSSSSSMEGAVEVVRLALASLSHESWHTRVHAEGLSNAQNRTAYAAIKAAAEQYHQATVSDEDLRQFALHLKFVPHDLDSDRTQEAGYQKQFITQALPSRDSGAVWSQLLSVCAELNGTAGEIDLSSASAHLGELAHEFHTAKLIRESVRAYQMGIIPVSQERASELTPLAEYLAPLLSVGRAVGSTLLTDDLPIASQGSETTLATRQLDRISTLHNNRRYQDALTQLELLEDELGTFDIYQQARWHFLRGMCFWHLGDDETASTDLEKSANLCTDDDRIAAGHVRAYMLKDDVQAALQVGQAAQTRFPDSYSVWIAFTNARVLNRELLTLEEIPKAFRDKSGVWQMLASSRAGAGDDLGAVNAIKIALEQSDSSIFIVENYLRLALRLATDNPFHVNTRSQPQERRELIIDAMSKFDDREVALWAEQSPRIKTDVVFHLAYAYLLLGQPAEALGMIEQGRQRGVPEHETSARVELEALCDLNREGEAVDRFSGRLEQLPDDALVIFGQACLVAGREPMLESAYGIQMQRPVTDESAKVLRILRHMHWELLLRQQRNDAVQQELSQLGVTPQNSNITDGVFAARAFIDNDAVRLAFENRVAELAPQSSDLLELSMASQWMLHARRHDDAIAMLERVLPRDSFTPLHVDLLHSYALTDQRAKVRELLDSLPGEWRQSADARNVALNVYGNAGDWPKMLEIAEMIVFESPLDASAWLLLIQVLANVNPEEMDACIGKLPPVLEGSAQDQLKLANAEISRGMPDRGIPRIYRTMRASSGNLEAAAGHISLMVMASGTVDAFLSSPVEVACGTSVELEDSNGGSGYVSIDFDIDPPLSPTAEFIPADSAQAVALIGLKVGETTSIRSLIGEQTLKVKQIVTIHRRLLDLSYGQVSSAVVPSKSLVAMTIPTREDGELDISFFIEQVERRKAQGLNTIGLYGQHMATLELIARMLGVDVIDLVRGWPDEGPLLEVSMGVGHTHDAFPVDAARDLPWVVDLSMLVELATLGMLDALEHIPRLYVATATKQAIETKIESSSRFRKGGTLFSHDGQLGIQEQTEDNWHRERAFLVSICAAIDEYCGVVPAYGPLLLPAQMHTFKDILGDGDYAALLVCLEYGGGLLSLDARLRAIAGCLEIKGASPQMLLTNELISGRLVRAEYSRAIVQMVMTRRSFVSIQAADLIAMMDQGETFANIGINRLRSYLAEPNLTFDTAVPVIADFVCLMFLQVRCNLGVMLQLIEYCFEPMFRHPSCPDDFHRLAYTRLLLTLAGVEINSVARKAIRQRLHVAMQRAERPNKPVTLEAKVSFAYAVPFWAVAVPSPLASIRLEAQNPAPASFESGHTEENRKVD